MVDGDLLLLVTEKELEFDIEMKSGLLRKRFMRELESLKVSATVVWHKLCIIYSTALRFADRRRLQLGGRNAARPVPHVAQSRAISLQLSNAWNGP